MTATTRSMHANGFSLIELLTVLAVMSVLLLAVYPMVELNSERQNERDLKRALWEIRDAIDLYKKWSDLGAIQGTPSGFPSSLQLLEDGVIDRRSGKRIYFLRHIPRDPFAPVDVSAVDSWGLRSYQSSAEQPLPGDDIYDVHSKSNVVALDGTLIRQW